MRKALVVVVALLASLVLRAPVRAGLYLRNDYRPVLRPDQAPAYLQELREVPVPAKAGANRPAREHFLRQVGPLEDQLSKNRLTMTERADLGACYVRLGRIADARKLLEAGDQGSFRILVNLATAYFVGGDGAEPDLGRAVAYQEEALRAWDRTPQPGLAGVPDSALKVARRVEVFSLKLLRSRQKEARLGPAPRSIPLDPLFPTMKFGKEEYRPGQLPARVMDELPPDALDLVWELCRTTPGDFRLLWLLAELFNASGQIEPAHGLMKSIADRGIGSSFDRLVKHRQVLSRATPIIKRWREPDTSLWLMYALAPRGLVAPGGGGPFLQETIAFTPLAPPKSYYEGTWQPPPPPQLPQADAPTARFTWRHVTIGFVSGALVAALVGLQWFEWRRRRQARVPAPPPPTEAVAPTPAHSPDTFRPASPDQFRPAGD